MNIFVLDKDADRCARYHNDKHVIKMILELAQLMSTAHHVCESPVAEKLYRKTHVNHPCAIWVRESKDNYRWTYGLFMALSSEYTYRYGKTHKTVSEKAEALGIVPPNIPELGLTEIPQCMPDDCKVESDPIEAYRNYYKRHKSHIASWKGRSTPEWY
jgi:hypothetical protein